MKTKLSVTIAAEIVEKLDKVAQSSSRSEIIEKALAAWLREERLRHLEDDVERYYRSLTKDEIDEDESWAELSGRSTGDTWS